MVTKRHSQLHFGTAFLSSEKDVTREPSFRENEAEKREKGQERDTNTHASAHTHARTHTTHTHSLTQLVVSPIGNCLCVIPTPLSVSNRLPLPLFVWRIPPGAGALSTQANTSRCGSPAQSLPQVTAVPRVVPHCM